MIYDDQITSLYDFSRFNKIVVIGGGHGGLITSILQANPQAFGVLFDTEQMIADARPKLEAAGIADRCATIAGDFFKSVPAGGDLYIMEWIDDWDDEGAIRILTNCRSRMLADGRVIMVMTGGIGRTASEFIQLLTAAGFTFLRVIPTETPTCIVEAEPAWSPSKTT